MSIDPLLKPEIGLMVPSEFTPSIVGMQGRDGPGMMTHSLALGPETELASSFGGSSSQRPKVNRLHSISSSAAVSLGFVSPGTRPPPVYQTARNKLTCHMHRQKVAVLGWQQSLLLSRHTLWPTAHEDRAATVGALEQRALPERKAFRWIHIASLCTRAGE